jgi:hypothetical protein
MRLAVAASTIIGDGERGFHQEFDLWRPVPSAACCLVES